jgi:hypothetical protein
MYNICYGGNIIKTIVQNLQLEKKKMHFTKEITPI